MSDLSTPEFRSTGERLMTEWRDESVAEHLHRYAIAQSVCSGKDVLDIACGEGYGSHLLAATARSVIGVDIAPSAIEHATTKYRRTNLSYRVGSAIAIPLPQGSVDVVVSFETLEHLLEQEEMLAEFKRVLRPGGLLVISTPDRRYSSDTPGYCNPFHVRELYTHEFRGLVSKHFLNVDLYFQTATTASLVVPEATSSGFEYCAGSFETISRAASMPRPLYNICLACDLTLPRLPVSVFDAAFVAEEKLGLLTARVGGLERELVSLHRSASYRIGRMLTGPVRWLRGLLS